MMYCIVVGGSWNKVFVQYSYANLSLLFARYHVKIIPWWDHKTADFVALGFGNQESDEDEDEDDHERSRQCTVVDTPS